ncbi:hypothetical protein Agub_g15261 [Astrephomene gubernaculifera]|uniref:Clp R domain-containing protein n=1 Tax=Astrephomene gubernaculifera TaxID=47775 RepID=A0AAD3E4G3_9CHLO|nr:hypothetical protein Agub_g15261 [Astrephomene gubernaculifera]
MSLALDLKPRSAGAVRGLVSRCLSRAPRAQLLHRALLHAPSAGQRQAALQLSSKLPRPQRFTISRRQALRVQAVFERFTERSIKTVMIAQTEAKAFGHMEVNTEHILLGLVAEESLSKNGYLNSGVSSERAKATVEAMFGRKRPITNGESIPFSRDVRKMFEAATHECKRSNVNFISPEHILLAMLSMADCNGRRVLTSLSADVELLKAEAQRRLKGDSDAEQAKKKQPSAPKEGPRMTEEYCRDLCAEVAAGRIDPVVGREREVSRVVQILARRTKNNPILLGEPGVGKTAIAEGLAAAVVGRTPLEGAPLPAFLEGKRILQLDVGLLIAGAKERGELESRVTKLIAEVKQAGNIILMIDEIHTLVGAGSGGRGGGGGLDIANLVKPALARGEFQVIGATTLDEHRKHIERDAALERRFQPVLVEEPDEAAALDILMGLKERYERHHRVAYTPEALAAAVSLSSRFIADRFLPDKAIDLMDEAGSRARIAAYMARQEQGAQGRGQQGQGRGQGGQVGHVQGLQRGVVLQMAPVPSQGGGINGNNGSSSGGSGSSAAQQQGQGQGQQGGGQGQGQSPHPKLCEYLQVLASKDEAVKEGLFEEAGILRRREVDYRSELSGPPSQGAVLPVVDVGDIEAIVSAWSGIPLERMSEDERDKLVNMRSLLSSRVVGQAEAVESLTAALCRARCGLKDPRRPVASLLFVGPTGVGKTELAKVLSHTYYGSSDALLRLDMSEYMERHSVSRLIGAPPGYVGFGEGGKLTEAVRRRPHCVVLFDEVEKAHPEVFAVLLQILEDGRLTDSQGRTVSFKNAMVILTSNIGSRLIAAGSGGGRAGGVFTSSQRSGGGASAEEEERMEAWQAHKLKQEVMGEVRSFFSPELLNRFDETIVFRRLSRAHVAQIAGVLLEETKRRAGERGLQLRLGSGLVERIVAEGWSEEYGARPLRQAIVRLIDDPLSDALLHRKFPPGTRLVLSWDPCGRGEGGEAGAVRVRTEEEEAEAEKEEERRRREEEAESGRWSSRRGGQGGEVEGGVLVAVGAAGGGGEEERQRVVLSATGSVEEN